MKKVVGYALLAPLFLCVIAPVARADTSALSQQPGNYIQVAMFGSAFNKVPPVTPQDMAEDPIYAEHFMFEEIEKAKKSYPPYVMAISLLICMVLLIYCFMRFEKRKEV